ncbi:MAG: rRNA maturation RNase YbeY, partial [Flavobacteriales bacterium]|nr:rRNA maturation RNase YbeY [Flavobacteriales bacterium]
SEELNRVIIHGILHLVGYNDKTEKEKEIMRKKEDYYINNFVI